MWAPSVSRHAKGVNYSSMAHLILWLQGEGARRQATVCHSKKQTAEEENQGRVLWDPPEPQRPEQSCPCATQGLPRHKACVTLKADPPPLTSKECFSIEVSLQAWTSNPATREVVWVFSSVHVVYSARLQMASAKIAILIWVSINNSLTGSFALWGDDGGTQLQGGKNYKESIWLVLPKSWNWVQISPCSNCYIISHSNGTLSSPRQLNNKFNWK